MGLPLLPSLTRRVIYWSSAPSIGAIVLTPLTVVKMSARQRLSGANVQALPKAQQRRLQLTNVEGLCRTNLCSRHHSPHFKASLNRTR